MTSPKADCAMNYPMDWIASLETAISPLQHLHRIQHFSCIDSTNKEAMRQLETTVASGQIIIADQQSAGRGRLGRTWHTVGDALAISIVLRPDLPPHSVPQLSLVTAVALQQALGHDCPNIGIKWPNDLLIHGAKVSGILTEMRAKPEHVEGVVIGIGVNLRAPQAGWPDDIEQAVTDLQSHATTTQPISRIDCAMRILQSLDEWYDIYLKQGFKPIRVAWWQAHVASGQNVRVFNGQQYIQGMAIGLDDDGALLLDIQGDIQRIVAGEVFLSH